MIKKLMRYTFDIFCTEMCDYNKIINSDTITGLGVGLSLALLARMLIKPNDVKPMNANDYCGAAIVGFSAATNLVYRPLYSSILIGGLIGGLISRSMVVEKPEEVYGSLEPIAE